MRSTIYLKETTAVITSWSEDTWHIPVWTSCDCERSFPATLATMVIQNVTSRRIKQDDVSLLVSQEVKGFSGLKWQGRCFCAWRLGKPQRDQSGQWREERTRTVKHLMVKESMNECEILISKYCYWIILDNWIINSKCLNDGRITRIRIITTESASVSHKLPDKLDHIYISRKNP